MVQQSMYTHIDEQILQQFNALWNLYIEQLTPLPTLVHDEADGKAAVFNSWLRHSDIYHKVFLKPEKLLTHNLVEQFSQKYKTLLHEDLKQYLYEQLADVDFRFLFSYFSMYPSLLHLEIFLQQSNLKQHIKKSYYMTSIEDYEENDPVFQLMKQISSDYLHHQLTACDANNIYRKAIIDSERILEKQKEARAKTL